MSQSGKQIIDEKGISHKVKKFISYGDDAEFFAVLHDGKLLIRRGTFYADTGEKICENNNND